MHSRRTFLTGLGGGTAVTLAGCGLVPSPSGEQSVVGEQWLVEAFRADVDPFDAPVAHITVKKPHQFRSQVGDHAPLVADPIVLFGIELPADQVSSFVSVGFHELYVLEGEFGIDAITSATDDYDEIGRHRGARIFAYTDPDTLTTWAIAARDGFTTVSVGDDPRSEVIDRVRMAVTVAEDGGEFLLDDEPADRFPDTLTDGFYGNYELIGTNAPRGYTVRVSDDTAHRRSIRVYEDEDAARSSFLLDEEIAAAIREREDPGVDPTGGREPHEEFSVERDGRAVTTAASLPADAIDDLFLLSSYRWYDES